MRIDEVSIAARISGQDAEIDLLSVLPQHSIVKLRCRTRKIGFADDLPALINPVDRARIPAQSAQVHELSFAPKEGVKRLVSGQVGISDNFAALIEGSNFGAGASQSTNVEHGAFVPEERM